MPTLAEAAQQVRDDARRLLASVAALGVALESQVKPHVPAVPADIAAIQGVVTRHYQLAPLALVSVLRDGLTARARHVAFRLCRELTPHANDVVGAAFNRERGTVENGLLNVSGRLNHEPGFPAELAKLRVSAIAALALVNTTPAHG